ncbi:MAG: hypothetical protein HQM00_02300 [Magnetococcales bacterium]|nr:hypothetical protein [Magnetococcales bacterium]
MFANYAYQSGASKANILNDLVLLATGTTDKTLLSSDCDQANTTITSTDAAGWSVYDSSAGTNAKCLRAPLADDASSYKYIVIDTNTTGELYLGVYDDWNPATHAGTNLAHYSRTAGYGQRWTASGAGNILVHATERHLVLLGIYGATVGGASNIAPCGCLERSRVGSWDVVGGATKPYVWWAPLAFNLGHGSSGLVYGANVSIVRQGCAASAPSIRRTDGAIITGSSAYFACSIIGINTRNFLSSGDYNYILPDAIYPRSANASGGYEIPFLQIFLTNYMLAPVPYGEISLVNDMWFSFPGIFAKQDEIVKDGVTYVALDTFLLFKKG